MSYEYRNVDSPTKIFVVLDFISTCMIKHKQARALIYNEKCFPLKKDDHLWIDSMIAVAFFSIDGYLFSPAFSKSMQQV